MGMILNPYIFGGGNDSFTKILLHMDGADTSTTFTDSNLGGSAHTWTAAGNAQIDTAASKFGGASGLFDGTGDYIDTPDHADYNLGSSDFTVDAWVRRNATGARQFICGQLDAAGSNGSIIVEFDATDHLKATLTYASGVSTVAETGNTLSDTAAFHHIAIIRSGNTLYTAIDGTLSTGTSVTGITVDDAATAYSVGRCGAFNGLYYNGWIDEFRLSTGIARWTANFTPPTVAYS